MASTSHNPLLCSYEANAAPKIFEKVSSGDYKETLSCEFKGRISSRKQIKIYTDKPWQKQHERIDIFVIKGKSSKEKLCSLTAENSCFQWSKSKSSREQLKLLCSEKVTLEGVISYRTLAKITDFSGFGVLTPTTAITDSPDMQTLNETTPVTDGIADESPRAPKMSKKRTREIEATPKHKSRRHRLAMRALSTNLTPPSKLTVQDQLAESPCRANRDELLVNTENNGRPSRCIDLSGRVPKPTSRWGHTMTYVNSELAVLIGGQTNKSLSKDSIWFLHPEMRCWSCPEVAVEGIRPEYRIGHSATYDATVRCIYVYGGSKNAKWFHDVHMFDLDEQKWTLVKAEGKAPTRAYHSSTLYRHELWVFGGVFPRPDPQPDGCDNEIHIFSPVMQSWHSATLINDLLVVFGGWDFPYCYNDLFVLDLTTVEWTEPKVFGKPPKPRSWHASSPLANNRVFIHGGYDGDNPLHDAHIFDYSSKTWQELVLENAPSARAGHACLRLLSDYENQEEDEIMIFGGGDNDGNYYSDMLSFYVPHNPKILEALEG
ncbi:acyl-CoA-binding domain-containing protein 4 [Plakobranchus ocellatus]|uniref:Acyl-CoA-binding domain-containing protein 4 n=1 Tax=Plakobranchus ocellatus TaxID=259542 RepID=A0AAV3Z5S5_9GAST|nr:acyl-CoA-binding domain-containing protein 4 [Plakobranchus ocellatus]